MVIGLITMFGPAPNITGAAQDQIATTSELQQVAMPDTMVHAYCVTITTSEVNIGGPATIGRHEMTTTTPQETAITVQKEAYGERAACPTISATAPATIAPTTAPVIGGATKTGDQRAVKPITGTTSAHTATFIVTFQYSAIGAKSTG